MGLGESLGALLGDFGFGVELGAQFEGLGAVEVGFRVYGFGVSLGFGGFRV